MAAPDSPKRFHLVLAHDLRDTDSSRQSVFKFWSMRFPDALITDFPFLDKASNVSFLNRAQALLLTMQKARDRGTYVVGPDDHLPCIFVCHGVGGSLVKQALVLASLDAKYGRYASDTAFLVLCNTPEAAEDMTAWQLQVCHLLTTSDLGSHSATSLFNELPEAFERLYWSFGAIKRHHSIINISRKDMETQLNMDTKQAPINRKHTLTNKASSWRFTSGNSQTEKIFDLISRVVKQEMQPLSEQFHGFMELLRRVDSNNYQLELTRPPTGLIKPIAEHSSFCDWHDLDPKSPNLLYFRMPAGISSETMASHLNEILGVNTPDHAILTFSFNKQDLRTQPITTFYVSLIRQLLLSQLSLFRRVSAIGDWIEGEENFSYEIFRSLFLSLLKGATPNPIICVLNAVQDCAGFPLDHIVELIKEFRRLSDGIFKVIVLSEESIYGNFMGYPDICRHIDMSSTSWSDEFIAGYVNSQVGTLVRTSPHWRGCEGHITEKLCRPSVTYTQATTSLRLLDSGNIPSTERAALDAIKKLPLSADEIYAAAVDQCERTCPLSLKTLLQWVLHSVRPLSMNELAVVVGLTYSGFSSIETLRSNIPLDIMSDLRQVKGMLIVTVGLHALPVHKSIVPALDEKWRLTDEDADSVMLRTCLDYLEIILVHLPTIPSTPESSRQNPNDSVTKNTGEQSSEPTTNKEEDGLTGPPQDGTVAVPEVYVHREKRVEERPRLKFDLTTMTGLQYELLEYAVTSWPEHYKRARNGEMVKGQILGLFSKNHEVQAWAALYQEFIDMDTEKFETLDSLLNIGCKFGLLDIVKDVIDEVKASKYYEDVLSDALDLAVGFGHENIVSLLIEEGAKSNEAPSLAAEYGFLDILQQLIKANPEMANVKDKFGRPPFLLAALSGNEKIASYLMANGADHLAAGGDSITGLQVAAMTGQIVLLRKLVDAGSDIHATLASSKESALMLAAAGGFDDIVTLLLSRGARINDQNLDGETALHRAVKHGHASTCDLLFAAGADVQIETASGLSPIHTASGNGYLGILRELLERSGDFLNQEETPANIESISPDEQSQTDRKGQANPLNVYDDSVGVSTPLDLAASNGYLEIMRELLKYPRYNSEKGRATALLLAASGGFTHLVEELLKTGITTIMKDTNGNNALHLATQEQYPDIVASLLRSDSGSTSIFDVNAQNDSGWTPLHLAALSGRLIMVHTLLHNGASINTVNSLGQTALHISSQFSHVWVVNALMDYLADRPTLERNAILVQDSSDDTAFIIAVRRGHYEVASALIEKSASLKPMELQGQKNALIESLGSDRTDLVKLLLDNEWDVNARDQYNETALHLAAGRSLLSVMELLISRGADCDAHGKGGMTPLHSAIFEREKVAVQTLLNKGANINAKDDEDVTPLWRASYSGLVDIVELLLESLPKPDLNPRWSKTGWTPLHASYDNARVTELLLMAGADPMAIDNTGDPTFFMAADYHSGHETLQKYIDAGIDINTKNQNGFTLIHVAADDGTLDTFKLLHENGADILLVGENGETALHLAAANSDGYEILRYLLEQGVDLEADCERYGTPLMAAVRNGPLATRLLLERGARVNAISKSCVTHNALQAAADRGSSDIVRILLEAGADANIRGGSSGSALCAAVMSGDQDSVMLLLDKEENINYAEGPKGSALEIAMSHQLLEIAELFFQRDVDVNTIGRAKYGTGMGTPLIAAVDVGEIIAIEKLLELHADVNLFPTGGESPVQIAVRKGRQNIVEILVKNGAKLDYRDKNDRGVLSHAVFYKSLDLVPYLLQQPDVDIDQEDEFGRTPLIYATMHGSMIISRILARKPKIDVQDRWGKTALTYAVNRDYGLLVSMLIASHADPLIQDIRGRDALYWAALQPNSNTFALVLENMVKRNAPPSRFQHAIIAATTTDNSDFVRQLLKDSYPWKLDHADQDGWTAAYTALSYDRGNIASLISQAVNTTGRPRRDTVIQLKPPREWHPSDMSAYLIRQPDNLSIKVKSDVHIAIGDTFAIARADHPMVPNNDGIYYFEIKVVHGGNGKCLFGVGFCDDTAYFNNGMLGWQGGSWGYHGDDGRIFESGQASKAYGPKYDEGSIIGCGVNFKKGTSFYTIDGKVIGRAFTNIRGKIYPAVSVGAEMAGCILTARFWDEGENANKLFKFQGPYDILETLEPSQRYKDEAGAERVKNDDSDGGSSTSYDESD